MIRWTWRHAAVSVGFSGYAPFASGSWGSLASVVMFAIASLTARRIGQDASVWLPLAGAALASVISVRLGEWAVREFGRSDPKPFVLDEFAGQWITYVALPAAVGSSAWWSQLAVGFVLFRIADVIKPPPARQLERLPAGWGILCDDLMAGVYAAIALRCAWEWTPWAAWVTGT